MSLAVFKKEMRSIVKERTFATTLLLQLFLILFYTLAILGIYVIMNPHGYYGKIDALVVENEYLDRDFVSMLDGFEVTYGDKGSIEEYDVVLEFTDTGPVILYVYTDGRGFRASYIISELKDALIKYEDSVQSTELGILTSSDIDASVNRDRLTISSLVFEFRYFLLVPLLMFLPIYLAAVLFIDIFTEEIAKKTLMVMRTGPISMAGIIFQKMLAALLLSMVQIVAWIVVLGWRGITVRNPLSIIFLLFLANIAVILFACLVSLYFGKRSVSQVVLSFVVIVLLVTKSFSFNTLNIVTKLAVIDVPFSALAVHALGLVVVICVLAGMVSIVVKMKYDV
jgi:ABC-type Na+ efflux pump permease subunit